MPRKMSSGITTPQDVISLLLNQAMNDTEQFDISTKESLDKLPSSQKMMMQIARQVLLIQEQQTQIEAQNREILKLKFTRNIRKMTDAELSEFGDAVVELHLRLVAGKLEIYDSAKYRAGFNGGKDASDRYIGKVIEPVLKEVGLEHWAYEPRIYKDIMPEFFKSYHVNNTRKRAA